MTGKGTGLAATIILWVAICGDARADSITFTMNNVFSGSGTPSGVPVLTIDDEGTPGDVKFIFDATPLNSLSEFITLWYLNTSIDLSTVGSFSGFTDILGSTTIPVLDRTFNTTGAGFKADGDGYYDWVFEFENSGSGRFGDGDKFSFYYSYPGITAQTFNVLGLSGPGSGIGPFKSAIHIQGVTTEGATPSLWISDGGGSNTIPEPGSAVLVLLGIAGGILLRWRQRAAGARRGTAPSRPT